MSFSELVGIIACEYESDARRLVLQSKLEFCSIEKFTADSHITEAASELTTTVGQVAYSRRGISHVFALTVSKYTIDVL